LAVLQAMLSLSEQSPFQALQHPSPSQPLAGRCTLSRVSAGGLGWLKVSAAQIEVSRWKRIYGRPTIKQLWVESYQAVACRKQ